MISALIGLTVVATLRDWAVTIGTGILFAAFSTCIDWMPRMRRLELRAHLALQRGFAHMVREAMAVLLCTTAMCKSPLDAGAYLAGNCAYSAVKPFQAICTPIHTTMNAITRRMPCTVVGATARVRRGAYA